MVKNTKGLLATCASSQKQNKLLIVHYNIHADYTKLYKYLLNYTLLIYITYNHYKCCKLMVGGLD